MYTSTEQSSPPSANAALSPPNLLSSIFPFYIFSLCSPPPFLASGCPSVPPAFSLPHDSLWVLQWNAGGLQARSTELLHCLSSRPVDLICIQESNLNSSFFRILGFSALRSDRTHSRSGILSRDATPASGSVVTFVRQGLSFSKLFISSLSLLDPYSDYVDVNISHNNFPHSLFLMCMPPYSLFLNGWQNQFLVSLHSSLLQKSLHSGGLQLPSPPSGAQEALPTPAGRKYLTGLFPMTSSPLMTLTHPPPLHRSSGSRSSPDISFAPSSLALSCTWEMLQDLGSDHLSILLSVPLFPAYRPNERPPSFNLQKAR